MKYRYTQPAFTLAELLIALAILGVIATFTIPKILDSGSNSKLNAIAREGAAMVSGAYQNYKLENTVTGSTEMENFTPYINYVRRETVSTVSTDCTMGNRHCWVLHNGALFNYWRTVCFGTTDSTSAFTFNIDPDFEGPEAAVSFVLYANGRLRTRATLEPNTYNGVGPACPGGGGAVITTQADPPWFSWSN